VGTIRSIGNETEVLKKVLQAIFSKKYLKIRMKSK